MKRVVKNTLVALSVVIAMIPTLVFALIILVFFLLATTNTEKIIEDLKEHQQEVLEYFAESEDVFNKILNNYAQYYHGDENYNRIYISQSRYPYEKFFLTCEEYVTDESGKKYGKTFEKDFFDTTISTSLTIMEMNRIFLEKNDFENSKIKDNVIKCSSFNLFDAYGLDETQIKNEIWFEIYLYPYDIKLVYTKSGEMHPRTYAPPTHEEYWINDNWYIQYYYMGIR